MENFLRGSKKWGCKAKKVGGVNTQNTPGFGTPACIHVYIYTSTDQICVEVFEKTIRRTEMIDHSFEKKCYGAWNRLC